MSERVPSVAERAFDAAHSAEPEHQEPPQREIRYEYSPELVSLLAQLRVSLLVSTYQAGKVAVLGVKETGELNVSLHNFERAMGIAVGERRTAVGAHGIVWYLDRNDDLAPRIDPPGRFDASLLTRHALVTGDIHIHEMAFLGDELWAVNTLFSCLCTFDDRHSFVPRWKPRFISGLAAEDRCHLNGMAVDGGRVRFVSAMAQTDTPGGWRPTKASTGCLLDVASGEVVANGFAMPHSPRVYGGRLWALDSGNGRLVHVDLASGRFDTVAAVPGYTRGLAMHDQFAFVGLSRIRETSTFGGVPIAERREELKCGVGVIHLPTGRLAAHFEFMTGVEEIFDVQVVPHARCTALSGPHAHRDETPTLWLVPSPPPGN
jgi:uncharacterized protein (TIGR03032 family)